MTWSGYQKKKMFRNLGGQAFKEISAEAGVDNDKDGRGIGDGAISTMTAGSISIRRTPTSRRCSIATSPRAAGTGCSSS